MHLSRARPKSRRYSAFNAYRRSVEESAAKWFQSSQCSVAANRPYCLANRDDWARNMVLPEVADYVEHLRQTGTDGQPRLRLHKYIHHGLSSQALLFNLICPLVIRDDLEPLELVARSNGMAWPGGSVRVLFEYCDREVMAESGGQPTSIDMLIRGTGGRPLFVESKFVELGFGGCGVFASGDCDGANPVDQTDRCYLHNLGRSYWPLLEKHGIATGAISRDSLCVLATNYQYFRELLFALECDGEFVLLSDARSPVFFYEAIDERGSGGRMRYLEQLTPEPLRARVHCITIQDVVEAIESTGRHPWIGEFKTKYGIA